MKKTNLGTILSDPYQLVLSISLLIISIMGAVYFVYTATSRQLTDIEGVYLQAITWVTGIVASLVFGRMSSRAAAREVIRPHARSSFRRMISLYHSISRVANTVAEAQESDNLDTNSVALSRIEAIVVEQLSTADDAIEAWRDIVPEDVEDLGKRIKYSASRGARYG